MRTALTTALCALIGLCALACEADPDGDALQEPRPAADRLNEPPSAPTGQPHAPPDLEPHHTKVERAAQDADAWMLSVAGTGVWQDERDETIVRAWVDARVANTRYDKRVFVEVLARYDNGQAIRTLLPAVFKGKIGEDDRWGTDAIELYPHDGPNGGALDGPALFRLRTQADDPGGAPGDVMLMTRWQALWGEGEATAPTWPDGDPWAPGLRSPIHTTAQELTPLVLFAPFDDPGAEIIARIDALTQKKRRAPSQRVTLHAAVFNMNDDEIIDAVIDAHNAGVEVRLIMDGRKFRPRYGWYRGDDRLLAAGVPLIGVRRVGEGAMHDKIVLFDGQALSTGSMNWEPGARRDNHENVVFSQDAALVGAYARRFEAIAGGVQRAREFASDVDGAQSVSFAPDEASHPIVGALLDGARQRILVAMFTAKDVTWLEHGRVTSLLTKLIEAHQRGVEVIAIIDHGIHEASEYYGVKILDDPIDEWLEAQGVRVIRADNPFARYASMHHKFVVIDEQITVTGAFNWYHAAAYLNDEDQLVTRSTTVAAKFTGEFTDLLRRYDPDGFQPERWPQTQVQFEVHHDATLPGDELVVVGASDALGAWDPGRGLPLDGTHWPTWRADITLPAGLRDDFKVVVLGRDGSVSWEVGDNHLLQVPTLNEDPTVRVEARF